MDFSLVIVTSKMEGCIPIARTRKPNQQVYALPTSKAYADPATHVLVRSAVVVFTSWTKWIAKMFKTFTSVPGQVAVSLVASVGLTSKPAARIEAKLPGG